MVARAVVLAGLCLFAFAAVAHAQVPQTDSTEVTIDLGYVKTTGNTDVQTISAREKLERWTGRWKLSQAAAAVNGETDGIETVARYDALLRADYELHPRVSAYARGDWRRDPFAGISSQFEEGVGAVLHAVRPHPHELDLEAGVGLLQRELTDDTSEDFGTARAGVVYKYLFTEHAYFRSDVSYLMNLNDTGDGDLRGIFALVAPLTGGVSLRVGYDVYYRTEPPAGFDKTDTTFGTGLQIRF